MSNFVAGIILCSITLSLLLLINHKKEDNQHQIIEIVNKYEDLGEYPKITVATKENKVYRFQFFNEGLKAQVGKKYHVYVIGDNIIYDLGEEIK